MKLKYYLRGLGIGVICTAIIMGIALSGNKKETLSDIEIIERARLLGMVMPEESQETETEAQDADGDKQGADPQGGDAQESAKKPVSKSAES